MSFRKLLWRSVENIQIWFKMDKNTEQFARDLITLIQMTNTCSWKTQRDRNFCPSKSIMDTRICHNVTLPTLKTRSSLELCPFQKKKPDTFTKQLSVFDRVWVHVSKYAIWCYSRTAKTCLLLESHFMVSYSHKGSSLCGWAPPLLCRLTAQIWSG
jgi:hypothetical protein